MISAMMSVPFFLDQPNSSLKVETALSTSAIALVKAANSTSRKNRMPISLPAFMSAKILGMVMNIRAGPLFSVSGEPPKKAKTAGMIISPARMAMAESKISTWTVDSSMPVSFCM